MTDARAPGRRGFLRSACRHCVGFGALGLAVPALAQADAAEPLFPARFIRPAIDSEEGGLWSLMDREETRTRRSPFAVRDEALRKYVNDLACRLGGDHCADVRVHVLRAPHFNASMAPNGMMQVSTGLLLRVDNEAQLAAVLGHEIGHYLERHMLERMRDLKGKTAAATFLGMFGVVGALASLGVMATASGFSREQEERADRLSVRLMQRAGYDAREAAQIWENMLAELKVTGGEDVGKRSALFATHPPAGDRRDTLLRLAGAASGNLGVDELERVVAPHRLEWLEDEVRRGQFEESLELFTRKLQRRPQDALLLFSRGEVRRLRAGPDDAPHAYDDLAKASSLSGAPVEVFRSLGLLHKSRGEAPAAVDAFQKYLALAPAAGDAGLIKTYLTESKP